MTRRRKAVTWEITVRWGNPYTDPPDSQPRELASTTLLMERGAGPRPDELPAVILDALPPPGSGYAIMLTPESIERKPWSPERKAKVRRANLRRRIAKQAGPLFAHTVNSLVAQEIARRASYYAGEPYRAHPL